MNDTPSNIPIPDPTLLTIEMMESKIEHLKETSDLKVEHLKELNQQRADLGDKALAAALQSAETIALRVEQTFTKQIEPLMKEIGDLKDRFTAAEAIDLGASQQRTETRLNSGQMLAIIGTIFVAASLVISILIMTRP